MCAGEWESKCNELQRMLLVRCLRPDRVIFACTLFVGNALGRKYVEPPVLDLAESYGDSTPLSPLIFVLSPGVDPTEALRKLGSEMGMGEKIFSVALGQGQVWHTGTADHACSQRLQRYRRAAVQTPLQSPGYSIGVTLRAELVH